MKPVIKLLLILLASVYFHSCEKDQEPLGPIPDQNFLNALIDLGVDTNGDSIISPAEAEAITYLSISERNISDLKGIEFFINLDTLICSFNQLSSLNTVSYTHLTLPTN